MNKIGHRRSLGYDDLRKENSFDHRSFGNNSRGHSTFLFNLNDEFAEIKYNLRFDQSPGEELLHLDFGLYNDGRQHKLISHKIVDFEEVYKLNQKLYIAMVFAGLFDAHFNTILPKIQGIENLNKRNAAFLYSLTWLWIIEKISDWINKNPLGYDVIEKAYRGEQVDREEYELGKKMRIGDYNIFNESNGNLELTYFGYVILQRYKRRMNDVFYLIGH